MRLDASHVGRLHIRYDFGPLIRKLRGHGWDDLESEYSLTATDTGFAGTGVFSARGNREARVDVAVSRDVLQQFLDKLATFPCVGVGVSGAVPVASSWEKAWRWPCWLASAWTCPARRFGFTMHLLIATKRGHDRRTEATGS